MKKNLQIFKLHFTSPLHIGNNRSDYSVSLKTIASDTMYAAMTAALAKVGNEISGNGDLGCEISSLFPFYQKDKTHAHVLFFPKPLKQQLPKISDFSKAKGVKKVQWLDETYFNKALNGVNIVASDDDVSNIKGAFLSAKETVFDEKFIKSLVSERVMVESRTYDKDAMPFFMDRVEFGDYSGLYFIVKGDAALVKKALNVLSVEGIGTDRTIGNGFFEWEESTVQLNIPDNSDCALSLSSYIPCDKNELDEMLTDGQKVAYEIQRRGGWITEHVNSKIRKNVIYLFETGSVFSRHIEDIQQYGKMVDLRPDVETVKHPVWRNGKAIMIPIKI